MRRSFVLASALLLGVLLSPQAASAQTGACQLLDAAAEQLTQRVENGAVNVYVRGPVRVNCAGGVTIQSDSAVIYRSINEIHLFRNVRYTDPERSVASQRATYSSIQGRMHATEDVVYTDAVRGSTLTGPEVEYFRAMAERPESRVLATGRPHLTIRPGGEDPDAEPFEVDADRLTVIGEDHVTATGGVVIRRNDLDATGSEAFFDASREILQLRGDANVAGERFSLSGDFVEASLPEGGIERVEARREARLASERLEVTGSEIRLFFTDDLLEQLIARGEESEGERPVALATGFRLEADSLEAVLPRQQLERVVAVGRARGEALDTLQADGIRNASENPLLDRDWITGDTITGYFASREEGEEGGRDVMADGEDAEVTLERLVARGSARSLYRVRNEGEPKDAPPALNYVTGERIELTLADGEMDRVEVAGLGQGILLDPVRAAAREEAGQTAAPPQPGRNRR